MEDQVVIQAALAAQPAVQDALEDDLVRHVDLDDGVDVVALQEELRLAAVAREAVEDEAVVPVVQVQPLLDHLLDDLVGHQLARRR